MIIKEYIFDKHKRIIAIYYNNTTLLSIDVHSNKWNYQIDYEVKEDDTRLIYHRINGIDIGAEWIEYVGLETTEGIETINIRVFYNREISEEDIKKAYCWALLNVENKACNVNNIDSK